MNKAPPPLIPAPHLIHQHHQTTQSHFAQKGTPIKYHLSSIFVYCLVDCLVDCLVGYLVNYYQVKGLYQCPECLCHKESPEELFTHLTLHHNFNRFNPAVQPSLNLSSASGAMTHPMTHSSIFDGQSSGIGLIQDMEQNRPHPTQPQMMSQNQLNMMSNPMMMTHQLGSGNQFNQAGNNSLHQNQNSL